MKGHMEKDGFHPHTQYKKGTRKSRDQSAKLEGVRMKRTDGSRIKKLEFKVWKFEDAPEDLQEKILEENRDINVDFDNFWAEYDGLIYDKKTKLADYDVFSKYSKKYYDFDRGHFIQFPELEIKDDKKLAKMLGIPESLRRKIDFRFKSERENTTKIEFLDYEWNGEIDIDESYSDYKEPLYAEAQYSGEAKPLTEKEFNILIKASEKWDDMMNDALRSLSDSYDYQFSDEAVKETLISNEYDFNEDGSIA